MNSDTCFIIPVYNKGLVVGDVVREVLASFSHVVCIDDGSSDDSLDQIQRTGATILRHVINRGQGAALQTGLYYAVKKYPQVKYFITFDADGQHRVKDAERIVKVLREGEYRVVLGSRFLGDDSRIPTVRRIFLKTGVEIMNRIQGSHLTDAHNGLRGFDRSFAESLKLTMSDMSHASEIIDIILDSGVAWCEVPVTIDYTDYSKAHGQSMFNAVNIMFDMILRRLFGARK